MELAQSELEGWVAVDGDRVVGHVALPPPAGPCLPLWVAGTGWPEDGIVVLSRLYLRQGWREAGRAVQQWGHRTVDSAALIAPG